MVDDANRKNEIKNRTNHQVNQLFLALSKFTKPFTNHQGVRQPPV